MIALYVLHRPESLDAGISCRELSLGPGQGGGGTPAQRGSRQLMTTHEPPQPPSAAQDKPATTCRWTSVWSLALPLILAWGYLPGVVLGGDDEMMLSVAHVVFLTFVCRSYWGIHRRPKATQPQQEQVFPAQSQQVGVSVLTALFLLQACLWCGVRRNQALRELRNEWGYSDDYDYWGKATVASWVRNYDLNDDYSNILTLEWTCPKSDGGTTCQYIMDDAVCNFPTNGNWNRNS